MSSDNLITTNAALQAVCEELSYETFVTVDTEFVREKTYWPILCLIQLGGTNTAVAVDPLAKGLDLQPLLDLMQNPAVTKVFHAAGQDLEIFLKISGALPKPLADTQVMAMVAGYGEQVGYENLVQRIAKSSVDKSNRYTDWSRRPLTDAQLSYALADVTHLRLIYETLQSEIDEMGRGAWTGEIMADIEDPARYRTKPEDAWKRLKPRMDKPKFLTVLRELAAWREGEAQRKDMIRGFILRDEAINEIAATLPTNRGKLARVRGLSEKSANGKLGQTILDLVQKGLELSETDPLRLPVKPRKDLGSGPVADLLKVLLKMRCEENKVAVKLIASSSDIDDFVSSAKEPPFMSGWRFDLFGKDAQALMAGELSLTVKDQKLEVIQALEIPN